MKKDEKGFGVLEVLFCVVVLGIIGGVSWYVVKVRTNDSNSPSTKQSSSDTSQTTGQEDSAYATYDKNPNFTIAYPKNWNVKTDNENTNSQYIFFSSDDFSASGKVYNDTYTVSKGAQFYAYISNEGLPATIDELLDDLKGSINNVADLYKTIGLSFQEPKALKTAGGVDYVSFVGHSSFMTPINNSSNALFLTKKHAVTLGYTYSDRTDTIADPSYTNEFAHFVESLNLR